MKGLILLANGFEDTEVIATVDVIKTSGIDIDLISISDSLIVSSKFNLQIKSDKLLAKTEIDTYDFIIIPGGSKAVSELDKSDEVTNVLHYFYDNKKLIASICAGPSIVGKLGFYKDKNFTCYPSFEKKIISGNYVDNQGIVVDGNFITGKSMAYSIEFGLKIVEVLLGKEKKDKVNSQIHGNV